MAKICWLPKDSWNTAINANIVETTDAHSQVPSHHVQQKRLLERKAPNWKEWAFTDRRWITNKENGSQSIGAGMYHSQISSAQFNKITTANPGGTSINKAINSAELEGIAAASINEHTHIATDSADALWQIRNSILYPQRAKRHNS